MFRRLEIWLVALPKIGIQDDTLLDKNGILSLIEEMVVWTCERKQISLQINDVVSVEMTFNPSALTFNMGIEGRYVFGFDIEDMPKLWHQISETQLPFKSPNYLKSRFLAPNLDLYNKRLHAFRETLPFTGHIYFSDEISEELFLNLQISFAHGANAEQPLFYIDNSQGIEKKGLLITTERIYSTLHKPIRFRDINLVNVVTDENFLIVFVNEEIIASFKGYWIGELSKVNFTQFLNDLHQISMILHLDTDTNPPVMHIAKPRIFFNSQTIGLVLVLIGILLFPFKYVEPRQVNLLDSIDEFLPFGSVLWFFVLVGVFFIIKPFFKIKAN
jgi:hypothetical protein